MSRPICAANPSRSERVAQYDVYPHPVEELRPDQPYVVEVQSSFIKSPGARITIPLSRLQPGASPMSRLNPRVEIAGEELVLDTLFMSSYDPADLRRVQANLRAEANAIWAAIDYALHGY